MYLRYQQFSHQLTQIYKTFRLIWAASRYWTMAWAGLLLVQGLIPIASVYTTRWLVDDLSSVMGQGFSQATINHVLLPVSLMAGILILSEVLQNIATLVRTQQSELVNDHLSQLIHQKSVEIDLACYESSDYYDHLNRIRNGASGQTLSLINSVGSFLQNSLTLLSMAAVLLSYSSWMPFLIIASALPILIIAVRLNREQYRWQINTTTDRRWLQYQEQLLTHSMSAPEVRLFSLGDFFQTSYQEIRHRLRTEQLNLISRQSVRRLVASLVSFAMTGFAFFWMFEQALLGAITLGDLALFYQALNRSQGMMRTVMTNLNQFHRNQLFIDDLFKFFDLQPTIFDPIEPQPISNISGEIRFKNVSFRYPGSQRFILNSFNLTIPIGKVVAIVGDNGAGKSTLTKLLCRFYDPERGSIELNGVDIKSFSIRELRRRITILFQYPVPYYLSAAESISLGDINRDATQESIKTAAKVAGADEIIQRLPDGYESQLGKMFPGGTDLSGGEWQRVALARAFFRQAPLIILDEPTSAMDPWAEMQWIDRFQTVAQGRTALLVTHRFPLAVRADIVHVMKEGQIVESGHHDELIMQGGLYAQSWSAQVNTDSKVAPIIPIGTGK
ncbi:MAG: ABC transporter ATP-binding protein [Cyanobacteria bacterium P01_D01_bin.156]